MHSTLPTHVLALAPDSLSSLGELDNDSLSELWSVFTRCKDNLQNGRRLENLSWRLWFDSGRRDLRNQSMTESELGADCTEAEAKQKVIEAGWSDPEWEETSDSESEVEKEGTRSSRSTNGRTEVVLESQPQPRGRTVSVPASAMGGSTRSILSGRGNSREWRTAPTISGDSLQRMITDASILPAITLPQRPRSLAEVPVASSSKPSLGSRGNSAPDGLSASNSLLLDANTPTPTSPDNKVSPSKLSTPLASSPQPGSNSTSTSTLTSTRPQSPTLTRTAPSSSALAKTDSSMPPPPAPTRTTSETAPSARRRSSIKLARSTSARKSKSASSAALPLPTSTSSSTQITRAPSEVHLKRNLSTAEVAASFKPQSFTQGFDVSSPPSQSGRPQVGRIAPPPTPAGPSAVLAESPPKSRAHSTRIQNTPLNFPDKVVPTASTSTASDPTPSAQASQPGPSALKMTPKPPGANKKIFFISSPNSESDDDRHSSVSKESAPMGSVPKIGSPLQQSTVRPPASAANGKDKGKGKGKEAETTKADDDDDWDDEDSEDDSSSGWGSEYSTESDVARNSTANEPTARPMTGRSKSVIEPGLFAKRPPSMVHLTPSMSEMGGPGELKRRPPGLLSQLFHPDQFEDDDGDTKSIEMKRGHKSMSSLPSMAHQQETAPRTKPRGLLGDRLTMTRQPTFTKKGKPEDVELESSSEESEDEEAGASKNETAAALARRQRLAELEQAAAIAAPPQTPRTTRRAMLATELSESLRRNLLWERQTRNRVMGGAPRPPVIPGQGLPQRSSSTQQLAPPVVPASESAAGPIRKLLPDSGVRAPNPSPANLQPPPPPQLPPSASHTVLPRRATLATDLSRASQYPKNRPVNSDSEVSDSSSDEDGEPDISGDMYTATALGRGVW
ncbi:hypothetical protein JCM3765_006504 [Sporobolomyces pararoseus]